VELARHCGAEALRAAGDEHGAAGEGCRGRHGSTIPETLAGVASVGRSA
jgi:hypothetical protein